jgi:Fe-S oxidoreductase/coenzyme F420-reducing hydrogenase delta subunit
VNDFNIILFLCSWGPHPAYQTLQDRAADIPSEIKMVRIPCAGRISKALLFKPFEMGADGVALVGCPAGSCRYGAGTTNANANEEDTRGILHLLGLGSQRLRLANFMPEDADGLLSFLRDFASEIIRMGKTPVSPPAKDKALSDLAEAARKAIAQNNVYSCQDCGKCSSSCPLTLAGKPFSPRALAASIISGSLSEPTVQKDVWACLTCGLCSERCPSSVNFPQFIREIRSILKGTGSGSAEVHGGFLQSLMRTMASPGVQTRHWDWITHEVRTDPAAKTLFFGGCAPYFDIFFGRHLGVKTTRMITDSIKLLNFFDITPALLPDERCCGHDLLWSGDRENFLALARLNQEAFGSSGAEEIIVSCPECYRTLSVDYPAHGIDIPLKITLLHDLIEREVDKGAVAFTPHGGVVTFLDPCRMRYLPKGRELPRKLIARLKPSAFKEMKEGGASSDCCGNCAWIGCDAFSKALQVKRIAQAKASGADLLVTGCPKCQIHMKCAMEDPFLGPDLTMEVEDLTALIVRSIHWE